MEYYPFLFIVYKKEYYCIWFSDEKDGFYTENKKTKVFDTEKMLFEYAKENKIQFTDNKINSLSIDFAVNWLTRKNPIINCIYFLNFWNTISDLANSAGDNFYGDLREEAIINAYNKLFWGTNSPAVTPKGKKYKPIWDREQRKILVKMAKEGIRITNSRIILKSLNE